MMGFFRDSEEENKLRKQDRLLKDFILVHPNVLKMVDNGELEGHRMALNHIHYVSIKQARDLQAVISFKENNGVSQGKTTVRESQIKQKQLTGSEMLDQVSSIKKESLNLIGTQGNKQSYKEYFCKILILTLRGTQV